MRRCERAPDLERFREAMLTIGEHVPGHVISYGEIDLRHGTAATVSRPERYMFEGDMEVLARYAHEHPAIAHALETGDYVPRAVSDFLSAEELHELGLYEHYFRPREVEDQVLLMLTSSPELIIGSAISRRQRGFSERDRRFLRLVAPLTGTAYLAARARSAATAALEGEGPEQPADLIAIGEDGRIAAVAGNAYELAEAYLGLELQVGAPLPAMLADWVAEYMRRPPAGHGGHPAPRRLAESERGELRGRLIEDGVPTVDAILILEERRRLAHSPRAVQAGLSERETEVAVLLTRGHSNDEIAAALSVSTHTVKRHLERVYAKLGVGSRAEAIAALLSNH